MVKWTKERREKFKKTMAALISACMSALPSRRSRVCVSTMSQSQPMCALASSSARNRSAGSLRSSSERCDTDSRMLILSTPWLGNNRGHPASGWPLFLPT